MLLSDKYTIYGDFDLKDNLCEYFNCKNIIFDFITEEDDDVPLIDKLCQSDKKILLIIDIPTIKKLCEQVSKYNNFLNLIDDGRIKLIYYRPVDSLFQNKEILNTLKDIKLTWLEDCLVGEDIKRQFKNIDFYQLHHPFLNIFNTHHFASLSKQGGSEMLEDKFKEVFGDEGFKDLTDEWNKLKNEKPNFFNSNKEESKTKIRDLKKVIQKRLFDHPVRVKSIKADSDCPLPVNTFISQPGRTQNSIDIIMNIKGFLINIELMNRIPHLSSLLTLQHDYKTIKKTTDFRTLIPRLRKIITQNSNKEIEKKNTFFSLIRLHEGDKRKHRYLLSEEMKGKDYLKDAITKAHDGVLDKDNDPQFFKDLESEYGKIFLDQATWKDGIPVISYYENTCFELVTECFGAIDGDDSFYFTEKTMKPIAMGHPFIMLSTKHFLKNLRGLGFKTFGDFIDESYDDCDNVNDRVEIISKNLERLNITESKKFYNDTRAICEYNQNHLMYLHGRYKFDLWKNLDELFKKYQ